jgi:hypothetical protein
LGKRKPEARGGNRRRRRWWRERNNSRPRARLRLGARCEDADGSAVRIDELECAFARRASSRRRGRAASRVRDVGGGPTRAGSRACLSGARARGAAACGHRGTRRRPGRARRADCRHAVQSLEEGQVSPATAAHEAAAAHVFVSADAGGVDHLEGNEPGQLTDMTRREPGPWPPLPTADGRRLYGGVWPKARHSYACCP